LITYSRNQPKTPCVSRNVYIKKNVCFKGIQISKRPNIDFAVQIADLGAQL